ncbi:MAG: hypothetical protein AMXMBFR58_29740 [Phycisphaerae bacterium]
MFIARLRMARGMTQAELASMAEVSASRITQIEAKADVTVRRSTGMAIWNALSDRGRLSDEDEATMARFLGVDVQAVRSIKSGTAFKKLDAAEAFGRALGGENTKAVTCFIDALDRVGPHVLEKILGAISEAHEQSRGRFYRSE